MHTSDVTTDTNKSAASASAAAAAPNNATGAKASSTALESGKCAKRRRE